MRSGRKTKEACLDRQTLAVRIVPGRVGAGCQAYPTGPDESVSIATAVAPGPPFGQAAVVSPSIQRAPKPGRSAVVLGLSPTGLYVMRELAAAGYGVLGVSDELAPGLWSRRATLGTWRTSSPDRLVDRLATFARAQPEPPVLFPTSDAYIDLVIAHAAELSGFQFQSSYVDGVAADLLDKERFYALCDRHGMHQPRRAILHDRDAAVRLIEGSTDPVPFPAILKPSEIHRVKHILRGRKVIIVRDRSELLGALRDLPFESTSWLLQEVVPGPESELVELAVYIDRAGRAVRTVTDASFGSIRSASGRRRWRGRRRSPMS